MTFYGDYHTHTKYSHGKGTIEDNVLAGIDKGIKEIAISDHGFRHGAYHVRRHHWPIMKDDVQNMKDKYKNIKIFLGLETNIINLRGDIDINETDLESLDILVCGYHKYVNPSEFGQYFKFWLPNFWLDFFHKSTKKQKIRNTEAYINAITKNNIDILSHPLRGLDADIAEIAKAAAFYGTYLELNGKNIEIKREDVDEILKEGAMFIANSDAHRPQRVANFSVPLSFIEKCGIPQSSIANLDKKPVFRSVRAKEKNASKI